MLLILDGHSSHLTPAFDKICEENDIISLCMPAHASHLLQPLAVGCFSISKRVYGALVMEKMRLGVNSIDKDASFSSTTLPEKLLPKLKLYKIGSKELV